MDACSCLLHDTSSKNERPRYSGCAEPRRGKCSLLNNQQEAESRSVFIYDGPEAYLAAQNQPRITRSKDHHFLMIQSWLVYI